MEGVLVKRQGEAVSTTVAVDTASVTGCRWWWRACRWSTRLSVWYARVGYRRTVLFRLVSGRCRS